MTYEDDMNYYYDRLLDCPVRAINKALKNKYIYLDDGNKLTNIFIHIEYSEYENRFVGMFIGECLEEDNLSEVTFILVRDYKKTWWLNENRNK